MIFGALVGRSGGAAGVSARKITLARSGSALAQS